MPASNILTPSKAPARHPALRRARSLLLRARELGLGGLLLLARAFALLLAARLALAALPVREVVAWKQRPLASRPAPPEPAVEATRIRHAVLTVARHSPVRFVCFPQCLAAAALLRARSIPSRLHYGVTRSPEPGGKLITHTWLEAAGQIVIGGEVAADYRTLAVYD